jgi:D-alanyl-D-alanine carboxypeptidase
MRAGVYRFWPGRRRKSESAVGRSTKFPGLFVATTVASLLLHAAASGALAYSPPKAALIIDANSGEVLYSQNARAARYPASLTKVMTLYIVFEYLRDGRLDMDTKLTVSAEAASRPPSKIGFKPGSSVSVRDAIRLLMTKSANDVAATVAENIAGSEAAFARLMTLKARALGMKDTTFRNASGLPDARQKTTAHDMAILARRVLTDFPEYAGEFQRKHARFRGKTYRNHNRLLFNYKGMLGLKTGFIRASGFNVMIAAQRGKKRVFGVVMGGPSARARDARARALLDAAWKKASVSAPRMAAHLPGRNPAFMPSETEIEIRQRLASAEGGISAMLLGGDLRPREDRTPERTHRPVRSREKIEARLPRREDRPVRVARAEAPESGSAEPVSHGSAETPDLAGPYHVQVGAYATPQDARQRLETVTSKAAKLLEHHPRSAIYAQVNGRDFFRARFGGFDKAHAASTCDVLKQQSVDCLVVTAQ